MQNKSQIKFKTIKKRKKRKKLMAILTLYKARLKNPLRKAMKKTQCKSETADMI